MLIILCWKLCSLFPILFLHVDEYILRTEVSDCLVDLVYLGGLAILNWYSKCDIRYCWEFQEDYNKYRERYCTKILK